MGIGTNNLIEVKTDEHGIMIPSELELKIKECKDKGLIPFMVNCTIGTTVLGAIDPISEIADICNKNDIWCHVDACWGGAVLLSNRVDKSGYNKIDSLVWDFHKQGLVPLQCVLFITKHINILMECNE